MLWEELLGVHPIGVTDNFVELGGNSLLGTQLVQRLEQRWGKRLPLVAVFQAPTIRELAVLLQLEVTNDLPLIVPIQPLGHKTPVFGIHILGEGFDLYLPMSKYLGEEQPIYGISASLTNEDLIDVQELATRYVKELRSFQPQGPYFLLGVSFGGIVAFEMAQLLHQQGQTVGLLGLLDAMAPGGIHQKLPLRSRLRAYWQRLWQLHPQQLGARLKQQVLIRSLKVPLVNRLCQWVYRLQNQPVPSQVRNLMYIRQNEQATDLYLPQVYPGQVVLFRAEDQEISVALAADPRAGWQDLAGGGLEIVNVPGNHLGILKEPYVPMLVEKLRPYLPPSRND
jgi:aspartate racemase